MVVYSLKTFILVVSIVEYSLYDGKSGFVEGVSVEEDLTLTYKEKMALDKFKEQMLPHLPHEYMKQDIYLIRWLRARNLNQKQAEEMLLENLKWRKERNMDTINEEDWSDMKDDYHYDADTFDREGRPIGTLNIGPWNFRRAAITGKMPRLIRYMDKLLEEATQAVITQQGMGKNVTQWKVILNLDGFSIIQHACPLCLPGYATFVSSYENHYPQYADALILLNTPPAFQVVLELVRPIFTHHTRQALKIYGQDKRQWEAALDKEISKEERRPEFGGVKSD
ncbi:SEC14-like protein 2 [Orchesella cincta]|uniref:SEC14-like protein 2 n=1 Tax=Orchesella cincta TaxID=48709 RepID=A0A1D2MVP2_ORCCI|nr:SEC14-like protein 2 [Orchesella cincta]